MTSNRRAGKSEIRSDLKETREDLIDISKSPLSTGSPLPASPVKSTSPEKSELPKILSLSGVIKDELFFISSLILFVGIISTETYYQTFGIKYQFLNLPIFHIIYHGLTATFSNKWLLFPYLIAIGWLILDGYAVRKNWALFLHFQRPLAYVLTLAVLLIAYPLARENGKIGADLDLRENTSSLPIIRDLQAPGITEEDVKEGRYRVLLMDSDYIVFFKPLRQDETDKVLIIHRLPKGGIHVLDTE